MNDNMTTQIRQMWATRPVRLPRNQSPRTWFFGVCEGIAVRYQVSPVLVRLVVGLSVILGGLGLWFYLTALLVLPRYGAPLAPIQILMKADRDPRYSADRALGVRTLVVVAIVLLISGVGSGGVTVGGVFGGIVATGVVWWLLHQRMAVPPVGLQIPAEDVANSAVVSATRATGVVDTEGSEVSPGVDSASLTPAEERTQNAVPTLSWDPLTAAPFAWDAPAMQTTPGATATIDGEGNPYEGVNSPFVPAPRRGAWRVVGGVLLAVLLTAVLAVVAGVSLVAGGVLHSQEVDTGTTSIRKFSDTAVMVNTVDDDRLVKATFSDIDLDLTAVAFPKERNSATITINSRFSDIAVVFPEKTAGRSYRIRVDCARVTASRADCAALDGIIVPSTSARGAANPEQRTLTVVVESSMSVVSTLQRSAIS